MSKAIIFGRAWFFDNDAPPEIEVWEHELEPMTFDRRSGADWTLKHFNECCDEQGLRELFGMPTQGSFQVLFKGEMEGFRSRTLDGDEWDEQFNLEESKHAPIPDDYLKVMYARKEEEAT